MGNVPFVIEPWDEARTRTFADGYLSRVHSEGTLPIPIEDIIELEEKISVIPVEQLMASGHEAYTSRDQRTIYIDQKILMRQDPNRRRSTLAHELAHILIHPQVFQAAKYKDLSEWQAFLDSIPDWAVKKIEDQAWALAGHILVPSSHLSAQYSELAHLLESRGLDISRLPPQSLLRVAKELGKRFCVSHHMIHSRAVRERMWEWNDLPGT